MRSTVLDFTGKKLALWFITHEFVVGHTPPYVTLSPTDIIHVIGVPRPSLFFCALPLSCVILNTNRRTKTGGDLGMRLKVVNKL